MTTRVFGICALTVLVVTVCGCGASVLPVPTAADRSWAKAQWMDSGETALDDGRDLYVSKCGGCHSLFLPKDIVKGGEIRNFDEMSQRAHMSQQEKRLVERYLRSVTRSQPGEEPPKDETPSLPASAAPTSA